MRAGRLKDRVSIQTQSSTEDAFGQIVGGWTETKDRRCSIEPVNGREYFAGGGEVGESNVRIRFRYEKNLIHREQRLVDNRVSPQNVYDVLDIIDPGNEHREIVVMAKVRQDVGN